MSVRKAICVGINHYGGRASDLQGCVNDAHDWASLLTETFDYDSVEIVLDGAATREALLKLLQGLVDGAEPGDALAFIFSGHGTWEPDREPFDEADGRDEAWCAVDGNLLDDAIRNAISRLRTGVRLAMVSDSCHSGTVTRSGSVTPSRAPRSWPKPIQRNHFHPNQVRKVSERARPRYWPSHWSWVEGRRLPRRKIVFVPKAAQHEVLLAGCAADEFSYDALIDGRYNGVFSRHAIDLLRQNPRQSFRKLIAAIGHRLPSGAYPQTPQLEGSEEAKDRQAFA